MKPNSISDIPKNGDILYKKRLIFKYSDEDQMELFLSVLRSIAQENGIKVEDGSYDYIIGKDY
tara:strand:- start:41 stop:229 length:189 start_codon:yes stop_codon:yes gene_type:complete